jgi:hypothetical protein
MKIILIVIGSAVVLVAAMAVIGARLPRQHTASRSGVVRKPPADVYRVIRQLASTPEYEIVADEAPRRLVSRIADTTLPYSGSWTFVLEAVPEGTRVTITEQGDVPNPILRFLSKYVFGHTKTMETYLTRLGVASGIST